MKVLIITDDDADGIMSAQCLKQIHPADEVTICYTRQQNSLDAANTFNLKEYNKVYVTDLSITEEWCDNAHAIMNDNITSQFVVIDHHKSAEWLKNKPYGIFDDTKSACLIVAEFYGVTEPFLNLARYISDRDIWEFKLPHTRAVYEYINLYDLKDYDTCLRVAQTLSSYNSVALINGDLIYQSKKKGWQAKAKNIQEKAKRVNLYYAGDTERDNSIGVLVPITNLTSDISETLHEVLELGFTCAASYFINDKNEVIISLRSTNGSALKIAKYHGGGGHDNAAGFKTTIAHFFENIMGEFND